MNVSLEPKKAFLGYPTATLLGQRVNAFGLSSPKERIHAVLAIKQPRTCKDLEHYIGLTGFL
ncbi:hypothetical protein K402DRAFT_320871, partial [Aulographum hederae CBS 113979]